MNVEQLAYYFSHTERLTEWRQMRYAIVLRMIYDAVAKDCSNLLAELQVDENYQARRFYRLLKKIYHILEKGSKLHHSVNHRRLHRKFLLALRHLLRILNKDQLINFSWFKEIRRYSYQLCKARFTSVYYYSFATELLDLVIYYSLKERHPKLDLEGLIVKRKTLSFSEEFELIDSANSKLFKPPLIYLNIRKIWGRINTNFDPHLYNHPYILYSLEVYQLNRSVKSVTVIRMGTPTKELLWNMDAEVIPEFIGYLQYLRLEKKRHLYINKQRLVGAEANRSSALQNLQNQFPEFLFVSIPSDGPFYLQQSSMLATQFKQQFFESLIYPDKEQGFYFPQSWLEDAVFQQSLRNLLDQVHEDFFQSCPVLDIPSLHNFIDHYYTCLELFLVQYSGVDLFNITCKDGIDRAAKEHAKLLFYLQVLFGEDSSLDSDRQRLFAMHVPAFFVKKRAIISSRRGRLRTALDSYTDTTKQAIRKRHEKLPIVANMPRFQETSWQTLLFNEINYP